MFTRRRPKHRAPLTPRQHVRNNSPTIALAAMAGAGVPVHSILGNADTGSLPIKAASPTFTDLVDPEPPFHKIVQPVTRAEHKVKHKTIAERKSVIHRAKHIRHHHPKPIAEPQVHKAPALKHVERPTPTHGVAVGSWAIVLSALESQLGVPYVYGGESPGSGFDCSGLTQWAYDKVGIRLPRTAADQTNIGYPVRSPKPGDLIFWNSPATHVAVYIGPGKMIAAPHTGTNVQVENIYGSPYYRRVL
jgi:cell wall-associated NlpC family hydrolase